MEPTKIPGHVLWRLNLVREGLADVIHSSEDQSSLGRMKAVLGLDQSIELLLSSLLPFLGVTVTRDWGLPKMLSEICIKEPSLESHRTPMERLRRLRDRVQHDGIVPSLEDGRLMTVQAEAFIRDCVRIVTGKEIEQLSLVSVIEQRDARGHLEASQQSLIDGDYEKSTTEAAIAFYYGWSRFKRAQPHFRSWGEELCGILIDSIGESANRAAQQSTRIGRDETDSKIGEFAHDFDRNIRTFSTRIALEQILEPLDLARLGVNIFEYAQFQESTPQVFETAGGPQPHINLPENYAPSQQDALFAFDFAMTNLTRLQSLIPKGEI